MPPWHATQPSDKSASQSRSQSFSGGAVGDVRSAATRAAFLSIPEENAVDDLESSPPLATVLTPMRRRSTATRPFERSFVLGVSRGSAAAYSHTASQEIDRPNLNSDNAGLNAGAMAFKPQNIVTTPRTEQAFFSPNLPGTAHMRRSSNAASWVAEEEASKRYSEPRQNGRRLSDVSSFAQLPASQEFGRWISSEEDHRNVAARAQLLPHHLPVHRQPQQPAFEFSSSTNGADRWLPQQGLFAASSDYLGSSLSGKVAVVLFKMQRADLFLLPRGRSSDWTTSLGQMVVVEADRGVDIGTIVKICDTMEEAMQWKLACMKEHYDLLLNLCQSPRPHDWDEELAFCQFFEFNPSHSPLTRGSRENNLRSIKRIATEQEIESYMRKASYEDKAKKLCCQLIRKHGLNVEIVESEFQLDMHKLTFYFWSPHYLHFSALVTGMSHPFIQKSSCF